MFKLRKKSELPARPKPPTWEQMEEDLKASTKTDVIFTSSSFGADSSDSTESEKVGGDESSQQELFQQAMDFVVKNDELEEDMKMLEEKKENLRDVTENLKRTVESVKKQALVAIDGYKSKG